MVALSHKLRWSGVLALLMMGLVSGCFSDEEEAAPTEVTDSPNLLRPRKCGRGKYSGRWWRGFGGGCRAR